MLGELKEKLDIIEVLSKYLPLRREGANFKAPCPFHAEKTASFLVSPTKQIYHCFGCQKHGDVINFLQEYKGLRDFRELLDFIEQEFGIAFEKGQDKEKKSTLKDFLTLAQETLKKDEKIRAYLIKRGLNEEIIREFEIGLAPENFRILERIKDKAHAEFLGLLTRGKTGYYSLFSRRIIFTIRNNNGNIAGFSGRSHSFYDFGNQGKYLNSKDSPIFKKSQILYNLYRAKDVIRKTRRVIIVEGFIDLIAMCVFGYKNTVASLGTAFNKLHVSALLRLEQNLSFILALDSDNAGLEATERCIYLLLDLGIYDIEVWVLRDYKDVGECLEKNQEPNFYKLSWIRFLSKRLTKNKDIKDISQALNKLKNICENIKDFIFREQAIKEVCDYFGLDRQYFSHYKVVKPQIPDLITKSIIKTAIQDTGSLYVIKNNMDLINSEYKESLLNFIEKSHLDDKLKILLFNEDINVLEKEVFTQSLNELKRQSLRRKITKAITLKDFGRLEALNRELLNLD